MSNVSTKMKTPQEVQRLTFFYLDLTEDAIIKCMVFALTKRLFDEYTKA